LLINEDIQEYSGRFLGWRCIQCGFRLDETIAQNRQGVQPLDPSGEDEPDQPVAEDDDFFSEIPTKPVGRQKRASRPARSATR
jgi:rubredoxin